jgi:hypothetical protein
MHFSMKILAVSAYYVDGWFLVPASLLEGLQNAFGLQFVFL